MPSANFRENVIVGGKNKGANPMKGGSKKKKSNVKNCLMNPFELDWIEVEAETQREILAVLKQSMMGLGPVKISSPMLNRKSLKKMSKEEKNKYIEEHKADILESKLNEENQNRLKRREQVIIGYNAVMRGLEKNNIACVFVEKLSKPASIARMFIPPCSLKSIPLIPIKNMGEMIGGSEMLGVGKCLAIGLKKLVCEDENSFHKLYMAAHSAHDIYFRAVQMKTLKKDEEIISDPSISTIVKVETSSLLTREQISIFHLPKLVTGKRAFTPNVIVSCSMDAKVENSNVNSGIIEVRNDSVDKLFTDELHMRPTKVGKRSNKFQVKRKPAFKDKKPVKKSNKAPDLCNFSSDDLFVMDFDGAEENEAKDEEILNMLVKKKGQKRKLNSVKYIPAKVQKVKGDPLRKQKIRMKAKCKKSASKS